METISLKVGGMSCASCASSIEKEVASLDGVISSSVNFAVETGKFEVQDNNVRDKVIEKIKSLGYSIADDEKVATNVEKIDENFSKFVISIVLAIMIFALAMWPLKGWPSKDVNWYLQLALCVPIWGWVGLKFQKSLLHFLKSGKSNMNTLIGLGTTAAFLYSFFITIFSEYSVQMGLTQKVYFGHYR